MPRKAPSPNRSLEGSFGDAIVATSRATDRTGPRLAMMARKHCLAPASSLVVPRVGRCSGSPSLRRLLQRTALAVKLGPGQALGALFNRRPLSSRRKFVHSVAGEVGNRRRRSGQPDAFASLAGASAEACSLRGRISHPTIGSRISSGVARPAQARSPLSRPGTTTLRPRR